MKYLRFVATDPDRPAEVDETGTLPVDEWVEKNDAAGSTRTPRPVASSSRAFWEGDE